MVFCEGTYCDAFFELRNLSEYNERSENGGRGDKAIKNPSPLPLAKPLAIPFLAGTGVAYNEAKRVTGARGVGPDNVAFLSFLVASAGSA